MGASRFGAPEQTLALLGCWAHETHGIKVGGATMHKSLARFGLTLKKRPCTPASKSEATSRRRARTGRLSSPIEPERG